MDTRSLALSTIVFMGSALGLMAPSPARAANPIPGIPILIKCPCPGPVYVESQRCCSKKHTAMVVGGLTPGSAPFDTPVLMQGRCAYSCPPGDPGEGRMDYEADSDAGPFTMILPALTLYSSDAIQVEVNGVMTPFDVVVRVSGPAPGPDDPMTGLLTLPAGSALSLGGSSLVASSTLSVHATTTFFNAITGEQAAGSLEEDFTLSVFGFTPEEIPVSRVADGTPEGKIVLGFDGSSPPVTFGYASPDGGLVLNLESLFDSGTVPARMATWGAIKTLYR